MSAPAAWKRLPNAASLCVLLLMGVNYFSPFADLDFTWQIRTGREVVRAGDLRPRDAFTYTIAGKDVPEYEGLYGAGLWVVWSRFGYGGLKLLRVLLVVGPLLLVGLRLRRDGVRGRGVALALAILVLVESRAWNLRPLYLSTIGLLLLSGRLHEHCTGRRPLPWWMPLLILAWANLHPGVVMGQALLAGAIGWEWLNRWARLNAPLDGRALWRLTWLGGLRWPPRSSAPTRLAGCSTRSRPRRTTPSSSPSRKCGPCTSSPWKLRTRRSGCTPSRRWPYGRSFAASANIGSGKSLFWPAWRGLAIGPSAVSWTGCRSC